ncbi:unnamed protein product [Porites evermanni]|uniref:G-protein coupled receptors family 1 profile domain-containing protein n=1 Tax=Porites evermanni TaxID=104178 RepID=A0ABN8LJ34_9CNID|nr:unnamed protein product [Porites evermanni]
MTVLAVEKYHALLQHYRTGLHLREFEDNIKKAETYKTCIDPYIRYLNQASKASLILDVVVLFVQLSIMIYCYGSFIRGLYFTNKVCATDGERRSEKKKLVITFMLVTFGFFMGYTPTLVSYVIIPSGDGTTDVSFYAQLTTVADFVFVVSFCFNPFIYAFRSTNFKEGFKRVILCRNP